jgi:uncharacterized HAD superfamily protein
MIFTMIILLKSEKWTIERRYTIIQSGFWNWSHKYKQEWYSQRLFFQKVKIMDNWEEKHK